MSPMWKIIDNEKFAWSKNIIMEEEKVERVREIGRNLAKAAADIENAKFMGDPGESAHTATARTSTSHLELQRLPV